MKTWLTLSIAAAIAAAASMATAKAPAPEQSDGKPYYYWLHPKLGHVKVDRETNAMLVGKRKASESDQRTRSGPR